MSEERTGLDELQAFHEERRQGIGSTDSAAILGVSPWRSAHDVWRSKIEEIQPKEPSLPQWIGLRLQDAIAELYTASRNVVLIRDEAQYVVGSGIVRAHVDYRQEEPSYIGLIGPSSAIVETKTARSKRGWGDIGTDIVPRHYWIQVQHQMACLPQVPYTDIAVLFGHDDFRIYRVQRNQAFIDSLVADLEEWWNLYVVTKTPPPVDGSEGSGRYLRERYPRDIEPMIPATPEQSQIVKDLLLIRENIAAHQATEEVLKQKLMSIIGSNAGMFGQGFKITWKSNKPAKKINWNGVADEFAAMAGIPEEAQKEVISTHTTERAGARPFVVETIDV